ncbi:MAG: GumC family protein [Bacillota bacterium]
MDEQVQGKNWDEIDLRDYLRVIEKWRWVIVLLTLTAMVTSGVLSYFVMSPIYQTKAVLMVTQATTEKDGVVQQRSDNNLESVVNAVSSLPQMTINTYVAQLTNDSVLEDVVKDLNLNELGYTSGTLQGMIQVAPMKDTNLIELKVSNSDRLLAAEIANTLSQKFLDFISQNNQVQMSKSVELLDKQIKVEEGNLRAASDNLEKYKSQPQGVSFLQQDMDAKSADLNKYRSQINDLRIQIQQLDAGKQRLEGLLAKTPATIVTKKQTREDTLPINETQQPSGVYTDEEMNPAYQNLAQLLDEKSVELTEKIALLASVTETVSTLEKSIEDIQANLTAKQMEQNRLEQQVTRLQSTYDLLAEKITQTQIAKSINLGETSLLVVSPASLPSSPVKPNKKLNIAIAGVLGIMVSIALAFVLEFMDNTVKTPEDIQRHLGIPVLGRIPVIRDNES